MGIDVLLFFGAGSMGALIKYCGIAREEVGGFRLDDEEANMGLGVET